MFLKSGALGSKEYKMVVKDYYEKFEKHNKKAKFRDLSISTLQDKTDSLLSKLTDKTYIQLKDYLFDRDIENNLYSMVSLNDNNHIIAYALVFVKFADEIDFEFEVDDIIIHEEDRLDSLADGEINIRRNIYVQIIKFIEELVSNHPHINYNITYNMIDSEDLCDALTYRGYTSINDLSNNSVEELINNSHLQMRKEFLKKEVNNELRLTRKQDQK